MLYSHRSNVLHSLIVLPAFPFAASDTMLPVVPLFHANAWGLVFTAPLVGSALVMPGAKLDGQSIYELLTEFKITCTAAVPTIWLMLLQHLEKTGGTLPDLRQVLIGGSAVPRAMIKTFRDRIRRRRHPRLGHDRNEPARHHQRAQARICRAAGRSGLDIKQKQGATPFGVEMKITDDAGRAMPWDGKTFGRVKVRGPAVAKAYYKENDRILDAMAFSIPATSAPWTVTAICRSPTVPRT